MKRDLINEIFRLTKLQTEALKDENIDEFIDLIEKKQVFIDKVNEVTNNDSKELTAEEREILLQTVETDERNREEFDKQFEKVKTQLKRIRALKKRDNIYANPYHVSAEEGMYIDKK